MKLIQDESLNGLIPKIKKRAAKIVRSGGDGAEDLELQLRFWFSKKYTIPMFSEVLDNYSIPDMLLEFFMHEEASKDIKDVASEQINESRDEIADMFEQEFSEEEKKFMDEAFGTQDNSWNFSEEKNGFE